MRRQQNGITLIGWVVLLIPVAIVGYAGIRLTPVYLNYMKVAKAMEQVANEFAGEEQVTAAGVHNALEKHFDIDSINYPPVNTVVIRREGKNWALHSNYEDIVPMFGSVSLLVKFDKSTQIQ